ncbi:hypothetical protein L798_04145 [Zootermopsis nevadensis]|uniref:Uncharacterized protein n=1 Tax=Zootermopsis nevadensis TaxID=136037 RepID=A0A067REH1_ZOONE|nr:hypothetical protein L798_04145 [Zootermopsis nevadensis]
MSSGGSLPSYRDPCCLPSSGHCVALFLLIALMMEVAMTFEMLLNFNQTTWRYNPEDRHLQMSAMKISNPTELYTTATTTTTTTIFTAYRRNNYIISNYKKTGKF